MTRLVLLTALTMIAFAGNSVLNRMALASGGIDAVSFGSIRLAAGAVMLVALCLLLRGGVRQEATGAARIVGPLSLLLYIYGFSAAYNGLDAGLGALILFGVVQITMFAGGLIAGEVMPMRRWLGAGLAFAGLAWLVWPGGEVSVSPTHGILMAAAGLGWGIYSLAGRRAGDALQATAVNFLVAALLGAVPGFLMAEIAPGAAGQWGIGLAVLSGAVTSGLGYALWYSLLPRLAASVAAVAQLTVPVIAMAGGMLFLSEALTMRFVLAGCLVLGGVAFSVLPRGVHSSTSTSSGS